MSKRSFDWRQNAPVFRILREAKRAFRRRQDGAVAVSFALSIVPLLALVGLAIDYSSVQAQKGKLSAAADSAALTAVGAPARSVTAQVAKERALAAFESARPKDADIKLNSLNIDVTDIGTERSVRVSYQASFPSNFGDVLGLGEWKVASTASASGPLSPYIDFYMLLDNSPSMALGATTADIDKLVNNTGDKCAFACHQTDRAGSDYYALARKINANLRIDVVRTATQSLMDTAQNSQIRDKQFGMAIYTFGAKAEKQELTEIHPVSTNLAAVKTAAGNIDLMTVPYQNYRGDTQTNFDDVFKDIEKKIDKPGDGITPGEPQKVLYFVSDGVNDANKNSCDKSLITSTDYTTGKSFSRCMEPINQKLCEKIKKRGIKIAVLYTTYFPLPTNGFYNAFIAPFQSQISDAMRNCASDGLFFEVGPNQGITEAMNTLFRKALNQVTLTR